MISKYISQKINNPAIPSLPLLAAYLSGAIPVIWTYFFSFNYLTLLLAIPVYILYKFVDFGRHWILISSISGLIISSLTTATNSNHLSQVTDRENKYCSIKGTVINVHFPNTILQWNQQKPKYLISSQEILTSSGWKKCSGKVLIHRATKDYSYGDTILIQGALRKNDESSHKKPFSYEMHLKSQNISHNIRADDIQLLQTASGFRSSLKQLFLIRDRLIFRATKNLPKLKHKKILASLFFGYKGLLDLEEKDLFQKSGTVHLFAVSGLHIGIAASFIYFFISFLKTSRKVKTTILLLTTLIYLAMTGAPPSAVRAYIMLAVWTGARAFLLPSTGLNNLSVAALIILIINPLNLFSLGFIYTFVITCSLILAYEKSLVIFKTLNEKNNWKGRYFSDVPFIYKIHMLFFCSLTASLSSWGLNVLFNQRALPCAFLVNLFTSGLAFLSFILASASQTQIDFLYTLQEYTLTCLDTLCTGGAIYWKTQNIALLWIIFFYLFFFKSFSESPRKKYYISCFVAMLIFISLPEKKYKIDIFVPSSSNIPTMNIYLGPKKYMINCSSTAAYKSHTNETIDGLFLSSIKSDHFWVLKRDEFENKFSSLYTEEKHSAYFRHFLQRSKISHTQKLSYKINTKLSKINSEKYNYEFTHNFPGRDQLLININREKFGKCLIQIKQGKFERSFAIAYENTNREFEVELPTY